MAAAAAAGSSDEIKCVNAIRVFCADVVQKANSGHPGELQDLATGRILAMTGGCRVLRVSRVRLIQARKLDLAPADSWRGRGRGGDFCLWVDRLNSTANAGGRGLAAARDLTDAASTFASPPRRCPHGLRAHGPRAVVQDHEL